MRAHGTVRPQPTQARYSPLSPPNQDPPCAQHPLPYPPAYLARIWRMVAQMSSVLSATCCSPGPSFCSRNVWIWLFLQAGRQGGATGGDCGEVLVAVRQERRG